MTVPLTVMARWLPVLSKMACSSWLTQVKAEPVELFAQLAPVPAVVSQVPLVVPFQVLVAAVPV